jgi:hypothetical protein
METFRLFIDIPIDLDESEAVTYANEIVQVCIDALRNRKKQLPVIEDFNFRLGHDRDRQKSNYLIKTESGHVTHKKSRVKI